MQFGEARLMNIEDKTKILLLYGRVLQYLSCGSKILVVRLVVLEKSQN